ncbi:MAG: hypothetical protein RIE86_20425 [Imperialibacter sp.]|uniref:hypothetical protein n=1 Tax=Imperialibacter sp. TaxID=2038411 RepID=UPI0032ED2223
MKNYRDLFESTRKRLNPEDYLFDSSFTQELATISYSDVLKFIRLAMKGVEPEYTRRTREAGERVKDHLGAELNTVEYKYQGSVMTDTHIKGYSDIDLVVISSKFYYYDLSRINEVLRSPSESAKFNTTEINRLVAETKGESYSGDAHVDLRELRSQSESILKSVYEACDTGHPKAIKITNKSLRRDVDIVIANWYDDVSSVVQQKGDYRGIQVYNKETNLRENPDYPFTSILRINSRGSETNGRLKKMIRFLKNVKSLSDYDINLTSFDINAICYDIAVNDYQNAPFYDLVKILYGQLRSICTNRDHANRLVSVDGREPIFLNNPEKLENVKNILQEVESIYFDLNK